MKEKITGQVEITKIDANDTDKKLEGAVFEILKDGIKIDTLTSDKNGKATSKKLEPGDYVLKEVQAPEGYNLSDKGIEFTISNEKVEVIKLQITNEKETGKGPEKPGGETETPGGETEHQVERQKHQVERQKHQVERQKHQVERQKSQVEKQKHQVEE